MDASSEGSLFKKNILPLLLAVGGLLFFGYGLMSLSTHKKDKPDILFEAASDKAHQGSTASNTASQITVDVEGAVLKPGVYKLKPDSRVQDALIAAGGMSDSADREKISKSLNLASKLTDGAKVYIPQEGDTVAASDGTGGGTVMGATSDTVNINSATVDALDALPGVGKVTAQKIIDNRPYSTIQELVDKKVVSKSVFDKIKDKIGI